MKDIVLNGHDVRSAIAQFLIDEDYVDYEELKNKKMLITQGNNDTFVIHFLDVENSLIF